MGGNKRYPGLVDGAMLALDILKDLAKIWGHARVGLVLTYCHASGNCMSSDEIATLTELHRDTVRRHLKDLTNTGRCHPVKVGRKICYIADDHWAERTHNRLRGYTEWVLANHDKPGDS